MDRQKLTLEYATPRVFRPEREAKLIIGLLITFLTLGASMVAIIIYMSEIS
jgi:hypothetical protein